MDIALIKVRFKLVFLKLLVFIHQLIFHCEYKGKIDIKRWFIDV